MKKIILIAFLMLSSQVQAADQPPGFIDALKIKNPNELAAYVGANEGCPVTAKELKKIVSGVLIRSRVKPLFGDEWLWDSLYLSTLIACIEPDIEGGNQIHSIFIHFGRAKPNPPILYDYSYGVFGIGDKDYIISSFKEGVEEAMTDFIKANFDL